ncbi:MAG: hypothetical protein AAFY17_04010 [Cyanobacteria bacterium J06642_11]
MPDSQDSSGLFSRGGSLKSSQPPRKVTREELEAWVQSEVRRAMAASLKNFSSDLGSELDKRDQRISELCDGIKELTDYVHRLELSSKEYEQRIYTHVSSVDQKVAGSEALRSVSFGMWDTLVEIVIPVRKAAQWVAKACLHFESLGPEDRRSSIDGKKVPGAKKERWRDR